jgi:hypothetical protein
VRIQSRNAEIAWLPFLDDTDANHRSVVQHPPTLQLLVRERVGEQLLRPFLGVMRQVESCVSFVFVKGKQIIVGRPCVRLQRRDDLLVCEVLCLVTVVLSAWVLMIEILR